MICEQPALREKVPLREFLIGLPERNRSVRKVNVFLYAQFAVKVAQFVRLMGVETIRDAVTCATGLCLIQDEQADEEEDSKDFHRQGDW